MTALFDFIDALPQETTALVIGVLLLGLAIADQIFESRMRAR